MNTTTRPTLAAAFPKQAAQIDTERPLISRAIAEHVTVSWTDTHELVLHCDDEPSHQLLTTLSQFQYLRSVFYEFTGLAVVLALADVPITPELARATEEDIEAVLTLNMILGEIDNCNHPLRTASFPVGPDREFVEGDPDYFDEDDPEHCKIVLNRILKVLDRSPGCTNRVIWGFHTMMSAENKVVDLTSDTLALHPDLMTAKKKAAKYDTALPLLRWFIQQCQGDSGTGDAHWEQFPEYLQAKALCGIPEIPELTTEPG